MGDKKGSDIKRKILAFLDRQGFYVVLFICVCIIAVTAVFATRNNKQDILDLKQLGLGQKTEEEQYQKDQQKKDQKQEQKEEQETVSKEEDKIKVKDVVEQKETSPKSLDSQQDDEEQKKPAPKQSKPEKAPQSASAAGGNAVVMLEPLNGKIIMDYGRENLVYSNTLKQWCSHNGIDIEAAETAEVRAVLSGVVSDIRNDSKLGIMIEIDHQNGFKSVYANLSTDQMVNVGQKVDKGQTISGVGKTAPFEIGDPPHLHFELIKNEEYVDPKEYIKFR